MSRFGTEVAQVERLVFPWRQTFVSKSCDVVTQSPVQYAQRVTRKKAVI